MRQRTDALTMAPTWSMTAEPKEQSTTKCQINPWYQSFLDGVWLSYESVLKSGMINFLFRWMPFWRRQEVGLVCALLGNQANTKSSSAGLCFCTTTWFKNIGVDVFCRLLLPQIFCEYFGGGGKKSRTFPKFEVFFIRFLELDQWGQAPNGKTSTLPSCTCLLLITSALMNAYSTVTSSHVRADSADICHESATLLQKGFNCTSLCSLIHHAPFHLDSPMFTEHMNL